MYQRSWVEIDIDVIKSNLFIYRNNIDICEIMAVVKADAYGHGAQRIAKTLMECGVKFFGVSNLDEALELRAAGITGEILVLGYTPVSYAKVLYENNITQTVISEQYAEELKRYGIRNKVHFAIDTGMHRIGLDASNPVGCEQVIRTYAEHFEVTGVFTHLCVADCPEEQGFTEKQIAEFKTVVERVKKLDIAFVHCMNSAGGLWCAKYGNLARLGIILYGLKPNYENILPKAIRPALTWKSVVSMVKHIKQGDTVGYGRSYRAEKDIVVATIPTGYADGYRRELSNKGFVIVKGCKASIIGKICMDQFMIDVTGIKDVNMGDEVILLGADSNGNTITADDMADMIETIGYEILCGISKRVPRKYICKSNISEE